ncbi:MAG: alpha/beta hydrolase [Chloroflexota bacterium]|nr:alpha/beta hydrolase [Chloroflexota bacterium]
MAPPRAPEDRYVQVNGLKFHYLDWGGDGMPPMVLLHGFTTLAWAWHQFAPAFADSYRVLALDQRGHGDSEWPQGGDYTTEDHMTDIAGFVDALGLERMVLIGHSMGGRNAIMYAACFPEKVERLVLVDSRPDNDPQGSEALKQLITNIPEQIGSVEELIAELKQLYPRLPADMACHLASHGLRETAGGALTPKYDLRMRQQSERAGYGVSDLWFFLGLVACPTLVVRGVESLILSGEAARRMCQVVSESELAEIEEAGHLVVQENPASFVAAVRGFLEKV